MQIGDALLLRSLTSSHFNMEGKWVSEFTFKAAKGKAFMVLLLGEVDVKDPAQFDTEPPLNSIGWYFCEDCQRKHRQISDASSVPHPGDSNG